jgi:aryl-alcohol dehydrogenase-like predicted oxidoreductase/predicted kinase
MRLSTDAERDDARAIATIAAAVGSGVTVFDTAHAYAPTGGAPGDNERLLARALRDADRPVRVVTKGGMTRPGGAWIPDGRAKAILADCEASLEALGGRAIDLYLLHAPDPRTSWRTSVRALARLAHEGLVERIGVSNVNRAQLAAARELAPIAAIQVALSVHDDRALRGDLLELCTESGIALIAHSPLGGRRRAGGLERAHGGVLAEVAARHGATPAEVALAWLLGLSEVVVAVPGARRPETARSAARAAALRLEAGDREALARVFGRWASPRRRGRPGPARGAPVGEAVIVMGIPGAGKTRLAAGYVGRGYERLNRDERGGSLRGLLPALDELLQSSAARVVLDNTYLTRAARSYVLETAGRHGVPVRCVWADTPLDQAQVNLAGRVLDHFISLPDPEALRAAARREPGLMLPTAQMRALRELEPPSDDEGFAAIDRIEFARLPARSPDAGPGRGGVLVAARALETTGWETVLATAGPDDPHLIFDWRPGRSAAELEALAPRLAQVVSGLIDTALCPHPTGPPTCWCRPPLAGLALAFARAHELDLTRGAVVGISPAHRTLARGLGAAWLPVTDP